jgi:hypothetical protein
MTPTEESSLLIRSDGERQSSSSSSRTSPPLRPLLLMSKKKSLIIVLASIGIIVVGLVSLTALHYHRHTPSGNIHDDNNMAPSLYGKKKSSSNYEPYKGEFPSTECEEDINYSKHTLKRAYDLPFSALFSNTRGQTKFEASDVTIVDDTVYAVCDSSFAISKFTRNLDPFSIDNVQIGSPIRHGSYESGYGEVFCFSWLFVIFSPPITHLVLTKIKYSFFICFCFMFGIYI